MHIIETFPGKAQYADISGINGVDEVVAPQEKTCGPRTQKKSRIDPDRVIGLILISKVRPS